MSANEPEEKNNLTINLLNKIGSGENKQYEGLFQILEIKVKNQDNN